MEKFEPQEIPSESEEENILKVFELFWLACAQRDLDLRFSLCAEEVTFFGTGGHERAVGKKQAREMSEKGLQQSPLPFDIKVLWKIIRLYDNIGWVECETSWVRNMQGKKVTDTIRLTTVFKKENNQWWVVHVHGSEPDYRLKEGEYMMNETILSRNRDLERQVFERTRELEAEKLISDNLLLNILPEKIAEELKTSGSAVAKLYSNVTVLFTDFQNFTLLSQQVSPQQLINELHECFKEFDTIIGKYKIEKIKTIGDGYLAVSGLPEDNENHAADMVHCALELRDFIEDRKKLQGSKGFDIRIGLNSGEVIAGIVGIKKFAYDIWGDTVNTAARMEQNCEVGKINISEATYNAVKELFNCKYRGEIEAKNKGKLKMFYVES